MQAFQAPHYLHAASEQQQHPKQLQFLHAVGPRALTCPEGSSLG